MFKLQEDYNADNQCETSDTYEGLEEDADNQCQTADTYETLEQDADNECQTADTYETLQEDADNECQTADAYETLEQESAVCEQYEVPECSLDNNSEALPQGVTDEQICEPVEENGTVENDAALDSYPINVVQSYTKTEESTVYKTDTNKQKLVSTIP